MTGLATILGATGFVGRRLRARLTALGWDIYAPAKGDKTLFGHDMGVVFYCAGLTADFDRRPFDTVEAHSTLLSELVQAGRFEQIIYLSSTRLYDGQAARELDESAPLLFDPADPRRIYDLSKALGENITLTRTEGRGLAQDVAGGLRTRQADQQDDRLRRRRGGAPGEGQGQSLVPDDHERALAARAVDQAGIEGIAGRPAQHAEQVGGPRVGARQRHGQFGRFEEDEVHASRRLRIAPVESRPKLAGP